MATKNPDTCLSTILGYILTTLDWVENRASTPWSRYGKREFLLPFTGQFQILGQTEGLLALLFLLSTIRQFKRQAPTGLIELVLNRTL